MPLNPKRFWAVYFIIVGVCAMWAFALPTIVLRRKLPSMLTESKNPLIQNSLPEVEMASVVIPQGSTTKGPTNIIARIEPFLPHTVYMILYTTDPTKIERWDSTEGINHWVNWSTNAIVSLPVLKDSQRYYYAWPIPHGRSPRFPLGHSQPPNG